MRPGDSIDMMEVPKDEKFETMKRNPITFFESKKDLLFKAINEGLETFLKEESVHCCFQFFSNKTLPIKQINEIKLMIELGFDIAVLEKSEIFFSKKASYLSSVTEAISKVAEDHYISFNPSLNINNITNILLELGKIYSKSKDFSIEDNTYNKLVSLLERYKIFFSIHPSDPSSILSLPIQVNTKPHLPIMTIVSVINLIFKNKSMTVWYDQKTGRLTISCIKRVSLTSLQINLINWSKKVMERYLSQKSIIIQDHDNKEISYSGLEPSEKMELKQEDQKFVFCKTIHPFKIVENYIQENFGHYCFQLQHYKDSEGYCYFKIIDLQTNKHDINQPSFIDFLSSLNHTIEESPLKFDGLDTLTSLLEDFTIDESVGLKFFPTDHSTDSKLPPSYTLRMPMRSAAEMNLCEGKVNYALNVLKSFNLDLTVQSKSNPDSKNPDGLYKGISLLLNKPKKIEKNILYLTIHSGQQTRNKSISVQAHGLESPHLLNHQEIKEVFRVLNEAKLTSKIPLLINTNNLVREISAICGFTPAIEFSSNNKSILLMLELSIRGLKPGFMKLFSQYIGINKYQGNQHHLVPHTRKDETVTWKGESSSGQYLELIKKIDPRDGWHSLLDIEKILGPDFEVILKDGVTWHRLVEPLVVEQPRPSFFSLTSKNKDEKVSFIVERLRNNQTINSEDLALLNKSRPISPASTVTLLIRGFNEHDTHLLEICYITLVKNALKITNLPDKSIQTTISYLTALENPTESTLPTISL